MKHGSSLLAVAVLSVLLATSACKGGGGNGSDSGPEADADTTVIIDAGLPDALVCTNGTVNCAGACIDPLIHRDFCGATTCEDDGSNGEQCALGSICQGGSCQAFACQAIGGGGGGPACNPVTQAGCATGEKCAQLVESADPFLARTACVPDGTVPAGDTCTTCGDGVEGYDNCAAGNDCLNGLCTEICSSGPPDSCRTASQAFDEGSYCTLFADLFSDDIGLCIAACNPTDDTVSGGVATNADCAASEGCYLNSTRGTAACSTVPAPAAGVTQNDDCYGPGSGGCFLNGCASGFTALLNDSPTNANGTVCARYCTPVVTHTSATGGAAGASGKCANASLDLVGGTNGVSGEHQCRFVQSFYSNTDLVPEEVGMCVPVLPSAGGTWADCNVLDWDGIKNAWNSAVTNAQDPNDAFEQFCLIDPGTPDAPDNIKASCLGFFRGCISLAEEEASLLVP